DNWRKLARDLSDQIWKSSRKIRLTSYLESSLQDRGLELHGEVIDEFDFLKGRILANLSEKIENFSKRSLRPRYKIADDLDTLLPLTNPSIENIRSKVKHAV